MTLSPQEQAALAARPTDNLQAYDLYLRGKSYARRVTRQDIEFALQMFESAVVPRPGLRARPRRDRQRVRAVLLPLASATRPGSSGPRPRASGRAPWAATCPRSGWRRPGSCTPRTSSTRRSAASGRRSSAGPTARAPTICWAGPCSRRGRYQEVAGHGGGRDGRCGRRTTTSTSRSTTRSPRSARRTRPTASGSARCSRSRRTCARCPRTPARGSWWRRTTPCSAASRTRCAR